MIYCLDTNICIYFLKGKFPSLINKIYGHNPNDIKLPSIVKAELLHGAERSVRKDENIKKIKKFIVPFETIPFGGFAAEYYAVIKAKLENNGAPIGPNDLIIAATAISINATLVTNNIREFMRVDGLRCENWIE